MRVKVNYDFDARNTKELTIRKGEVIEVVNEDPGGWWLGTLNGMQGLFPANYTYIIEDAEEDAGRTRSSSYKIDQTKVKPFIRKLQTQCGFRSTDGETETGSLLFGMKGRMLESLAANTSNSEKDEGEIEEIAETEQELPEATSNSTNGQSSKLSHLTRSRPTRMSRQQPSRNLAEPSKEIAELKQRIQDLEQKLKDKEQVKVDADGNDDVRFWQNKFEELQKEMDTKEYYNDDEERIDQLEKELDQIKRSNYSLENQVLQLQTLVESLRNENLDLKSSLEEEKSIHKKSNEQHKELETLIIQLRAENKSMKDVQNANKTEESNQIESLQRALENQLTSNQEIRSQLESEIVERKFYQNESEQLQKKIAEMNDHIANLKDNLLKEKKTESDSSIEREDLAQRNKELEASLRKAEATCKTQHKLLEQENIALHQQLKQHKEKLADADRSITEMKQDKIKLQTEFSNLQHKLELDLEQQRQQASMLQIDSQTLQKHKKQLETEIDNLKVVLNQERADKQKALSEMENQKSRNEVKESYDTRKDDEILSLKESLKVTSQKLTAETQSKVSLEKSVKRLEVELQEFKKRMIDLLVLLENKNLTIR